MPPELGRASGAVDRAVHDGSIAHCAAVGPKTIDDALFKGREKTRNGPHLRKLLPRSALGTDSKRLTAGSAEPAPILFQMPIAILSRIGSIHEEDPLLEKAYRDSMESVKQNTDRFTGICAT